MNYISILFVLFMFLYACTDENIINDASGRIPEAPEGKANIAVKFQSGSFNKPVTKATIHNDGDFDNPWVLSFKLPAGGATTSDAVFVEAVPTKQIAGQMIVQLSVSNEPHVLYFVANADAMIMSKKESFSGKTYDEISGLLTFGDPVSSGGAGLTPLSNPQGRIPFVNEKIPMTSMIRVDKIEKNMSLEQVVNLSRIVSKLYIDATKANQKNSFILTGFTVADVPSVGYFDNMLPIDRVTPQEVVDYGTKDDTATRLSGLIISDIVGNTTKSDVSDRPVYVYPFLTGDNRGGEYGIILSGHFGNNIDRYFYVKLGGPKSSAQLNKPNVSYKINVESVENRGYATIEEALVNYQPGTGVVCRVTLLDDFHELVANGQYYLGLSNSEFCFYADGEQNDIIVTTVTTNAYDRGNVAPSSSIELLNARGMELVAGQTINSNSTDIKVNFTNSVSAEGTVRVTIGNLVKDISVTKQNVFLSNYESGNNGVLIGEHIVSAYIQSDTQSGNGNVGLATMVNSLDRRTEIETSLEGGTDLYLFYRRRIGNQDLKICAYNSVGNTRLIELKTSLPQFAGSNIYWDGTKLTFDDTPSEGQRAPHERYQGLYFRYGSLFALGGDASTPEVTFNPTSEVYDIRNIPYAINEIVPPLNQSNREDNLSGLNIDDYSKGIGDICRYMTARGWAPLGKKWKTPSGYELKTLENNHDLLTTIGPYGEDNSKSHQWGQYEVPAGTTLLNIYFPVSGLRDNSNGRLTNLSFGAYYNSSSATATNACVAIVGGRGDFLISPNSGRYWFRTVRCVVDDSPEPVTPIYTLSYDVNKQEGRDIIIPKGTKLLRQHVEQNGSVQLSGTRLEASGRVHVGWSINGKEYALGGLVNNITSDLVAKAIWVKGYWVGNSIWASGNLCSGKFATTQEYISKVWNGGDYYNWNCKDPLDIDKEEIYTGWNPLNDPCPIGWKTPSKADFDNLVSAGYVYGLKNGVAGYWFGTVTLPTAEKQDDYLFMPSKGGYRDLNSTGLAQVESYTTYWSTIKEDAGGTNPYLLELKTDNSGIRVRTTHSTRYGVHVRCIKDID